MLEGMICAWGWVKYSCDCNAWAYTPIYDETLPLDIFVPLPAGGGGRPYLLFIVDLVLQLLPALSEGEGRTQSCEKLWGYRTTLPMGRRGTDFGDRAQPMYRRQAAATTPKEPARESGTQ